MYLNIKNLLEEQPKAEYSLFHETYVSERESYQNIIYLVVLMSSWIVLLFETGKGII